MEQARGHSRWPLPQNLVFPAVVQGLVYSGGRLCESTAKSLDDLAGNIGIQLD